jgi:hypothetical protein
VIKKKRFRLALYLTARGVLEFVKILGGSLLQIRKTALGGEEGLLLKRIHETSALFARRRYVVPVQEFSQYLLGGAEDPDKVRDVISRSSEVTLADDFVLPKQDEYDLEAIKQRRLLHQQHRPQMLAEAVSFGEDLVKTFPFIKAICLTGSLASGGFVPEDDIDFNLFVDDSSKYTAYLTSILLSLKYSLRHRKKPESKVGKTPLLPKVICINVIFRERDCIPFVRRDRYLGFELLLQEPIYGINYYQDIFQKNQWLKELFPQIGARNAALIDRVRTSQVAPLHMLWRADHFKIAEFASKWLTRGIFEAVQLSRWRNKEAQYHVAKVRQFQFPYGVFQEE